MTVETPLLGRFQISGLAKSEKFIVLSDEDGRQIRYRVTPEIIYKLAVELPRYANQIAIEQISYNFDSSKNLRVKVDAVEASSTSVNVDDSGTTLVLSVTDKSGIQCSWSLDASLANQLGKTLIARAKRMGGAQIPHN
jgi:hypothetical protein